MVSSGNSAQPLHERLRPADVADLKSFRASWLLSDYRADEWVVTDASGRRVTIDFACPFADGTTLTDPENRDVLATVKAYAREVRQGPYECTSHASVQAQLVHSLMYTLGWMRRNHIRRFSQFKTSDIRIFLRDAPYGIEAVTDAANRLGGFLQTIDEDTVRLLTRKTGYAKRTFDVSALLKAAGITPAVQKEGRIAWVIARQSQRLGLRVPVSRRRFLNEGLPEREVLKAEAMRRILRPLEDIYRMRRRIEGDTITFLPFKDGASATAHRLGDIVGRTPTVPAQQALHLIDQSIRWVVDISDEVLKARQRAYRGGKLVGVPNLPDISLNDALRFVGIAAYVVIFAFTARRRVEVITLEAGAVSEDAEGLWLTSYIAKTLQEVGRTPCPEIVRAAVDRLERLNTTPLQPSERRILDRFCGAKPGTSYRINLEALDDFATYAKVPLLPDGSKWHFTPHQFRRFFALVYFWQWSLGDLPSLAHHLRHTNLDMTERYLREAEAGAIMADTGRYFTHEVLTDVVMRGRTLQGQAGDRIADLARKIVLLDRERISGRIERLIQRTGVIFKPTPYAFCACPTDRETSSAACRAEPGVGPDTAGITADACSGCPFAAIGSEHAALLRRELTTNAEIIADQRVPAIIREAAAERNRSLERLVGSD